jgi:hypothetical protein
MEGAKRVILIVREKCYRRRFPFTLQALLEEAASLVKGTTADVQIRLECAHKRVTTEAQYTKYLAAAGHSGLRLLVDTKHKSAGLWNTSHASTLIKQQTGRLKPSNSKQTAKSAAVRALKAKLGDFAASKTLLTANRSGVLAVFALSTGRLKVLKVNQVQCAGRCIGLTTGEIMYTGGIGSRQDCALIDAKSGASVQMSSLIEGRCFHSMLELPSKEVMVLGGKSQVGLLSSTEAYDGKVWRLGPPMNKPRSSATACLATSKVYVVGGKCSRAAYADDIEVLDGGVWSVLPVHLHTPLVSVGAAAWDNSLIIFGGTSERKTAQTKTELIDLTTYNVTEGEPLPRPDKFPSTSSKADDKLVCALSNDYSSVYVYEKTSSTWTAMDLK